MRAASSPVAIGSGRARGADPDRRQAVTAFRSLARGVGRLGRPAALRRTRTRSYDSPRATPPSHPRPQARCRTAFSKSCKTTACGSRRSKRQWASSRINSGSSLCRAGQARESWLIRGGSSPEADTQVIQLVPSDDAVVRLGRELRPGCQAARLQPRRNPPRAANPDAPEPQRLDLFSERLAKWHAF